MSERSQSLGNYNLQTKKSKSGLNLQ